MIHQAGHSTLAAKSPQPDAGHQGHGGGLRYVLGGLFPTAPAPVPLRWSWRMLIAIAQVLAVCLGAVVLLLRVPGRPWDSLYAEDYYLYIPQALQNPWHLFSGWEGYLQLVTRLVVRLVTCLALADAAKGAAVSGALVAACCALFTTTTTTPSPATTSGSDARSGRLPAPAVVVLAGDCLAVAGHTGSTVVGSAAVFARLVAVPPVG
jgi:hypothetical protein